jgi:hypothetical protein
METLITRIPTRFNLTTHRAIESIIYVWIWKVEILPIAGEMQSHLLWWAMALSVPGVLSGAPATISAMRFAA